MDNHLDNDNHTVNNIDVDKPNLQDQTHASTSQLSNDERVDERHVEVGTLELLEERAVVDKERLDVGRIVVSKNTRTRTVNVPIELVEEVMTIDTEYYDPDSKAFLTGEGRDEDIIRHIEPTLNTKSTILVNGNEVSLADGPIDIVLSRQMAVIKKETHVVQDVSIEKSLHTHKDSFDVELRHEELDVIENGDFDHQDENKR